MVVGLTAAKALALALEIPLIAVDHLEGHLYACQLAYPDREVYPVRRTGRLGRPHQPLSLPEPARVRVPGRHDRRRGGRGVRQGGQPARPGLSGRSGDRARGQGRQSRRRLPFPDRSCTTNGCILSFSGLKTAVLYALARPECAAGRDRPCDESLRRRPGRELPGSGRRRDRGQDPPGAGADRHEAAGRRRRRGREFPASASGSREMAAELGVELFIPPPALCTDNAAMAGIALAQARRRPGRRASISTSPAGLVRPGREADMTGLPATGRSRQAGAAAAVGMMRRSIAVRGRPLLRVERAGGGQRPAPARPGSTTRKSNDAWRLRRGCGIDS